MPWNAIGNLPSKHYTCGHCGHPIASQLGAAGNGLIYFCHFCDKPTYFGPSGEQVPGIPYGAQVSDIDDDGVHQLYEEARKCTSACAYTSAVLSCRKLLMHIAVGRGAKEGKSFIDYVNYLADNHYIPPDAKDWVDHIRKKGNEANHEIKIMNPEDAEDLISFIEMLLRLIYEFPANIRRRTSTPGIPPATS